MVSGVSFCFYSPAWCKFGATFPLYCTLLTSTARSAIINSPLNQNLTNGGDFVKTTTGQWIFLILSLIVPLIYLSMYLPIWNGKELLLANSGTPGIVIFVFQCICIVFAILCLCFDKIRNGDSCLLTLASAFFFIASLALTLLTGFFFILELFGVPWFPAQR